MTILRILPDEFTLYRFDQRHAITADWISSTPWYTISKTSTELSILCPSACTPPPGAEKSESGWRTLQVDAVMDFGLVGVLASIIDPLRDEQIPVFVVSTFDTDYILIKSAMLEKAIGVLIRQKDTVLKPGASVVD